jgi:GxxExxY protein
MGRENHQGSKPSRIPIASETDGVARQVVDAAFRVHTALGQGLLESVYETCSAHELVKRGIKVERQLVVPLVYDDLRIDTGFRMDLVVGDSVAVELKAVVTILPVHKAQLLTYLKLSGHRLGFLINFNATLIREGITRRVL